MKNNNNTPLVSIITPLYNTEQFLSDTIDSVLSQTYKNWEWIVIDDCSNDGSVEIITRKLKGDQRVKVLHLPDNTGAALARNTGIEEAKGDYIAFLDSDDIWFEKKLERHISFMKENRYFFSFTSFQKIDKNGKKLQIISVPKKVTYRRALLFNPIDCSTAIYNVQELGKIFMPNIQKRQDYGLWLKILKSIKYGYGLNEVLTLYRVRYRSISSNKLNLIKYQWKLYRDIEKLKPFESVFYLGCDILSKVLRIK